ncbi:hypothetical protein NC652_010018 [Populus alba x Populus x berolinensis]|nr:hypothetical protein NC652_010018 [Populus alba x Populus x berolinensis]
MQLICPRINFMVASLPSWGNLSSLNRL